MQWKEAREVATMELRVLSCEKSLFVYKNQCLDQCLSPLIDMITTEQIEEELCVVIMGLGSEPTDRDQGRYKCSLLPPHLVLRPARVCVFVFGG